MQKIGITGGIGSGKSFVCRRLEARGFQVYDCDAAAKRLIHSSLEIREGLTRLVGAEAYVDGHYNKAAVARFLLASEENAHAVDAVVHPAVFRDFQESGLQWMESAILYESGIVSLVDRVVVVTAPRELRIRRVMQRDGISRAKVQEWMRRQLPQREVRRRAHFEIVNDERADIDAQLDDLLKKLQLI